MRTSIVGRDKLSLGKKNTKRKNKTMKGLLENKGTRREGRGRLLCVVFA